MTLHRSWLVSAMLYTAIAAHAQEIIERRVPLQKTTRRYDSIVFVINGTRTSNDILKLFKPHEIELKRIHDPNVSQKILTMEVIVFDTSHVVLKYLNHKASMDVGNQNFRHGIIPDHVHPNLISKMRYVPSAGHQSDILVLELLPKGLASEERIKYVTQPESILWYDVDGKIMSQEEMSKLELRLGEFESGEVISGEEATKKYGDPKYADGVKIVRRTPKKD